MNGDAFCAFDLCKFVKNAEKCGSDIALLAVDCPKVNTFRVGSDGCLVGIAGRFGSDAETRATFSGVSWYSDRALSRIRDDEFDIREFWKQEILASRAPFVDMSQLHATWIDMGSPEGLMEACDARLKELNRSGESVVEPSVKIPSSATVKHSVLFDGAVVHENEIVENEIRGKNFIWKIENKRSGGVI